MYSIGNRFMYVVECNVVCIEYNVSSIIIKEKRKYNERSEGIKISLIYFHKQS